MVKATLSLSDRKRLKDAESENVKKILLGLIDVEGTQARAATNYEAIADYTRGIDGQDVLPPVVLFTNDSGTYYVGDGHHRIAAALGAKQDSITAIVKGGNQADALWYACGANQKNGLRMSRPDKRRAVELALGLQPDASDRAIADHCGVSHTTVQNIKKQLAAPEEEATQDEPLPQPPEPNGDPVDRFGVLIPGQALPALATIPAWVDLAGDLSKARSILKRLGKGPGGEEFDTTALDATLKTARAEVLGHSPYAVCPYCRGADATCPACGESGYVNKLVYESAPDKVKGGA